MKGIQEEESSFSRPLKQDCWGNLTDIFHFSWFLRRSNKTMASYNFYLTPIIPHPLFLSPAAFCNSNSYRKNISTNDNGIGFIKYLLGQAILLDGSYLLAHTLLTCED